MALPGAGKGSACQRRRCKRHRLKPWAEKIAGQRKWQPTPVSLLGESQGRRSLAGYRPWGCKESDTTDHLTTAQALTGGAEEQIQGQKTGALVSPEVKNKQMFILDFGGSSLPLCSTRRGWDLEGKIFTEHWPCAAPLSICYKGALPHTRNCSPTLVSSHPILPPAAPSPSLLDSLLPVLLP